MAQPAKPVDPTPEDTGGPVSQATANYRDGNLIYHCGLCKNFEGAANGTCTKVTGSINPYMLSDEYDGVPNPLRDKTPSRFRARPEHRGTILAAKKPDAVPAKPARRQRVRARTGPVSY